MADLLKCTLSCKGAQFGLHDEFDFRIRLGLVDGMLKGLEMIKLVHDGHLAGIAGSGPQPLPGPSFRLPPRSLLCR